MLNIEKKMREHFEGQNDDIKVSSDLYVSVTAREALRIESDNGGESILVDTDEVDSLVEALLAYKKVLAEVN